MAPAGNSYQAVSHPERGSQLSSRGLDAEQHTQTFWIARGGVQTDRQMGQKLSRAQCSENITFVCVKSLLKVRIFHKAFPHQNMGKRVQSGYCRQVMCALDEDAFQ